MCDIKTMDYYVLVGLRRDIDEELKKFQDLGRLSVICYSGTGVPVRLTYHDYFYPQGGIAGTKWMAYYDYFQRTPYDIGEVGKLDSRYISRAYREVFGVEERHLRREDIAKQCGHLNPLP